MHHGHGHLLSRLSIAEADLRVSFGPKGGFKTLVQLVHKDDVSLHYQDATNRFVHKVLLFPCISPSFIYRKRLSCLQFQLHY